MSYPEMLQRERDLAARVVRWLACLAVLAFLVWAIA